MSAPVVWCWEDGVVGGQSATCTLPDGHDGDHAFIPDSEILVGFFAAGEQ